MESGVSALSFKFILLPRENQPRVNGNVDWRDIDERCDTRAVMSTLRRRENQPRVSHFREIINDPGTGPTFFFTDN